VSGDQCKGGGALHEGFEGNITLKGWRNLFSCQRARKGYLKIPNKHGLEIELDPEAIKKHQIK
jgi:L-alanine-DL-glutamate epimerase-like enolase superfamily enzyme